MACSCKTKRQSLGLRQSDLAAQCGVAEATIMRFERTGRATLEVFTRIAVNIGMAEFLADALQKSLPVPPRPRTAKEFLRGGRVRHRIRVRKLPG